MAIATSSDQTRGDAAARNAAIHEESQKDQGFWRRFPGVSFLTGLSDAYGIKFLIMVAVCCHWCKGYNYFTWGIVSPFFLGEFNVPAPVQNKYGSAIVMPWAMKPLVAILSDCFPIGGYNKMPYLVMTSALGAAGILLTLLPLGTIPVEFCVLGFFLGNCNAMSADILAEGMYSRRLQAHPQTGPDLVAFVWIGQSINGIFTAFVTGLLLEYLDGFLGWHGTQWVMATTIIPMVVLLFPTLMNYLGEEKVTPEVLAETRHHAKKNKGMLVLSVFVGLLAVASSFFNMFVSSVTVSVVVVMTSIVVESLVCVTFLRLLIGLVVCYNAIESVTFNLSLGGATFYFSIDGPEEYPEGPHFSDFFYASVIAGVAHCFSLLGLMAYSRWCGAWTYRKVKGIMLVLSFLFALPSSIWYARLNVQWGIPDEVFVLGDTAISEIVGQMLFMPTFLIISRVCPKSLESTMFSVIAATSNFANQGGRLMGSVLLKALSIEPAGLPDEGEQFDNLWIANLIVSFSKLISLAFLWMLPPHKQNEVILDPESDRSSFYNSPYRRCTGQADELDEGTPQKEGASQK